MTRHEEGRMEILLLKFKQRIEHMVQEGSSIESMRDSIKAIASAYHEYVTWLPRIEQNSIIVEVWHWYGDTCRKSMIQLSASNEWCVRNTRGW